MNVLIIKIMADDNNITQTDVCARGKYEQVEMDTFLCGCNASLSPGVRTLRQVGKQD
jgi:hypothetical protein